MGDLQRHFSRGSFRGWGCALRAHHYEVHIGRKINDAVSRMSLTHKLLYGQSCQGRMRQQFLQRGGLCGCLGCESLWPARCG
jgi:hypothetical protein